MNLSNPYIQKVFAKRLVIFILSGLFCLLITGCGKSPLYSNIGEKEANEMVAVLANKGVDAEKVIGTVEGMWTISVPQGEMSKAVEILSAFGRPRDQFANIGEVFKKSGLVSSPTEERIRFMYALSQSIAETIAQVDGVLTARVHVVLMDNDPLRDKVEPASASVFVKYRRGAGVENLGPQIKRLVTNSIEGLSYDKVSIAFFPSVPIDLKQYTPEEVAVTATTSLRKLLITLMVVILLLIGAAVAGYWFYQTKMVGGSKKAESSAKSEGPPPAPSSTPSPPNT